MLYEISSIAIKACLISSLYPFAFLLKSKALRMGLTICLLFIAVALHNRTLFLLIIIVFAIFEKLKPKQILQHRILVPLLALVTIVCFLNIDSIIGRLFIWMNILNHLSEIPILGFGPDSFKYHYASWQAQYFANSSKWSKFHMLADSPSFAFNEILHFYIEYGIISLFVLGTLFGFNIYVLRNSESSKIKRAASISNFSILTFAMLSYSLHSIFIWLIVASNHFLILFSPSRKVVLRISVLTIFASIGTILYVRYKSQESLWLYALALPSTLSIERERLFNSAFIHLKKNQYFLHDYCGFLLNEHKPETALSILNSSRIYFNQFEFSLLAGNAYLQQGIADSAYKYFDLGHKLIPNRLLPLSLLFAVAKQQSDTAKSIYYAKQIISTPIKIPSSLAQKFKRDAGNFLRSIH